MIISQSRHFIFLHLHKCAGTSVEAALEPHLAWNDIILGASEAGKLMQRHYLPRFGLSKHASAQQVFDAIGAEAWDGFRKVAVVRDPYSRMVSLYLQLGRELDTAARRDGIAPEAISAAFRDSTLPKRAPYTYPGTHALIAAGYPQADFRRFLESEALWKGPGAQPQSARLSVRREGGKRIEVDHLMRFETLDDDWTRVGAALGINAPLEARNQSGRYDWRSFYDDPASGNIIKARFASDFEAFGYPA